MTTGNSIPKGIETTGMKETNGPPCSIGQPTHIIITIIIITIRTGARIDKEPMATKTINTVTTTAAGITNTGIHLHTTGSIVREPGIIDMVKTTGIKKHRVILKVSSSINFFIKPYFT